MIYQLQPFQNVVANGIASTDLRHLLGTTIKRLTLALGGTFTKAMITGWQLKANTKVIAESTGSRTDARMAWRGITANAGFLTIDFTEIRARTYAGLMAGAIDTSIGIRDLRLELTIAGATSPTLSGWAEVTGPQLQPGMAGVRPLIARVQNFTQTIGAAGTFALNVPHLDPNSGGSIFKRIAVFAANMTGFRVERNGVREHEMLSAAANNFNSVEYERVAQAGLFMLDFIEDGYLETGMLDTRPQAKCTTAAVYGTFTAGETITVEAETLEPMEAY